MVTVHLKRGSSIEVKDGVAVAATVFPALPGNTPALGIQVVTADGRVLTGSGTAEVGG